MELDKVTAFCFVFTKKKSAADAHRIICETYGKNVLRETH